MSDFLTNLVMRSFSPTPSFQPVVAPAAEPSYVEAEEESVERIAQNPVIAAAKPSVKNTDKTDETEPIEPASLIEPPIVTRQPQPVRREVLHKNPEKFESPKPEFTEQSVVPVPVETQAPPVKLTVPETKPSVKSQELIVQTPPIQSQPSKRQVMRKPVNATSTPMPAAPSNARPPTIKTRKSEPPTVEQVIEQVTNKHVTEQVIERPVVKIENRQEITSSFTALIPKPQSQPLPLPNPQKSRPNQPMAQTSVETEPTPLPPDTVINVAIGRIEVRATPAPSQRRERQSSGPKVMTLDDYVQQRSRGAQ